MGLGEAEARRGLLPAQVTQLAEAESGLGPGLHPLPVNFRGDGGGTAGWQEGPADALTRKGLQGICWARGWEIDLKYCWGEGLPRGPSSCLSFPIQHSGIGICPASWCTYGRNQNAFWRLPRIPTPKPGYSGSPPPPRPPRPACMPRVPASYHSNDSLLRKRKAGGILSLNPFSPPRPSAFSSYAQPGKRKGVRDHMDTDRHMSCYMRTRAGRCG